LGVFYLLKGIIMNSQPNYFTELAAINVTEHLEKKGKFSYLSWPYAVAQLRQFDDHATWEVVRFNGLPYLTTESGTFVEVAVMVKGVTLSQIHPVLDVWNQPIQVPTAFDINTSIQRCLVKAIALHGLGLNVYAGEDLLNQDASLATHTVPPRDPIKAALTKARQDNGFSTPALLTANQLRYIKRLMQETETDVEQLLAFFDFESLELIPKHEVNRVIQVLENHRQQDAA
jgi:hypothetical protein